MLFYLIHLYVGLFVIILSDVVVAYDLRCRPFTARRFAVVHLAVVRLAVVRLAVVHLADLVHSVYCGCEKHYWLFDRKPGFSSPCASRYKCCLNLISIVLYRRLNCYEIVQPVNI